MDTVEIHVDPALVRSIDEDLVDKRICRRRRRKRKRKRTDKTGGWMEVIERYQDEYRARNGVDAPPYPGGSLERYIMHIL